MKRTREVVERDLERMRELRDALWGELETVAGQGREDRMVAYRQAAEACRRLADEAVGL
jgi:hypothetical protein